MRTNEEMLAGGIFAVLGVVLAMWSAQYDMGTATTGMGPGYLPRALGVMLAVLGTFLLVRSQFSSQTRQQRLNWRAAGVVLGSILVFGLLLRPAGLVISTFALALISGQAVPRYSFVERIGVALVLTVLLSAVFIFGFNLPLGLWPA